MIRFTRAPLTALVRPAANPLCQSLMLIMIGLAVLPQASAYDRLSLDINGVQREALVYPGKKADEKISPLLLAFHGRGDSARNFARSVRLHTEWKEATVIYPNGTKRHEDAKGLSWLGSSRDSDVHHDLEFVDALIEEVSARYKVDDRRVFAAGFSNGAAFTYVLLERKPETFAAFAMVGALAPNLHNASTPKPVLLLYGRDELKYSRNRWNKSVADLVSLNRGSPESRTWNTDLTLYPAGSKGGAPTVVHVYRAGHVWPHQGSRHLKNFFDRFRMREAAASTTISAAAAD